MIVFAVEFNEFSLEIATDGGQNWGIDSKCDFEKT
jgi:hypothetical protein